MKSRTKNYLIVSFLVVAFTASLVNIKYINKLAKPEEDSALEKNLRFLLPFISMASFFIACYFVSLIIIEGSRTGHDKFTGIIFMSLIGIILLVINGTILSPSKLTEYIKGKKFSIVGMFMALGVSSIVFGFLDNFGMKLGTEALDDNFLQLFLGPFSTDRRFTQYKKNIQENLQVMNKWVSSDWRKIINHTLRFKDEIAKSPKMKDLTSAIDAFGGTPLNIPKNVLENRVLTNAYVDNLRDKFDVIDGSKAMLGNTFSDFIGALLGAGIVSLFIYMTCYDGIYVGDDTVDNHWAVEYLSYYAPILEAFFISFGCLVPVFLNIAMSRMGENNNNLWAWVIVGGTALAVTLMMYFSVYGIKVMTLNDKEKSIKKTLEAIKERVDLTSQHGDKEKEVLNRVDTLINSLNNN